MNVKTGSSINMWENILSIHVLIIFGDFFIVFINIVELVSVYIEIIPLIILIFYRQQQ